MSLKELLLQLINYEGLPRNIEGELKKIGDAGYDVVILERKHLINVLNKFLNKDISGEDMNYWAELIEVYEDIGYEEKFEDEVIDVLFELANPYLTEPLTEASAKRMLFALKFNS